MPVRADGPNDVSIDPAAARLIAALRESPAETVHTAATTLHTFLADAAGRVVLHTFAAAAFLDAETRRAKLRAAGFFPYLVCRPGGWSIGLARSEAEATRRNEL
jgi:hypothetical protein